MSQQIVVGGERMLDDDGVYMRVINAKKPLLVEDVINKVRALVGTDPSYPPTTMVMKDGKPTPVYSERALTHVLDG